MNELHDKQIVLGITGGIAAYKSAELARRLYKLGAKCHVVMTDSAKEFITPLTMQAVSGHSVHDNLFDPNAEAAMGHIELARLADVVLIAPATADFIAKLAHGFADDLLTTLCLATKAPIVLAPAMNRQMWHNSALQTNLEILTSRHIKIIGPGEGEQACGDIGLGRMSEVDEIIQTLPVFFCNPILKDLNIVITAGPTQEPIDPIRYLTNKSSGKMGYALANAAAKMAANVTLISGPVKQASLPNVNCINVDTTDAMHQAVMTNIKNTDIFIAAAAVADYKVKNVAAQKIKKTDKTMTLELIKNVDILADVAKLKQKPFVVGFAAETEHLIRFAKAKLKNKKLDMIIANRVGNADAGFDSDNNACTVLWDDKKTEFALQSKEQLAIELLRLIAVLFKENDAKNSSENFR